MLYSGRETNRIMIEMVKEWGPLEISFVKINTWEDAVRVEEASGVRSASGPNFYEALTMLMTSYLEERAVLRERERRAVRE